MDNKVKKDQDVKGIYGGWHRPRERWGAVDKDTDVLITHTPPYGVLDYSRHLGDSPPESVCQFCDKLHPRVGHAGSFSLREAVLQTIRPKVHLFGHLHGSAGLTEYDGITFSNAAFVSKRKFNVIDIYSSWRNTEPN